LILPLLPVFPFWDGRKGHVNMGGKNLVEKGTEVEKKA
jgi:hypothetical protein